jgi:hypothetical protein
MDKEIQPDEATKEAEEVDATHAHAADRAPTSEEEAAADRARDSLADDGETAAEHYKEMTDIGVHAKGEGRIDE